MKALSGYRAKRNFAKTQEPRGDTKIRAAEYPRFVVHKHDATRLHYDLRLEAGGVFKSWAVTRGPSLDPKEKRLAVEVEDHPLDYGDFEGTIPEGEYGGGTVMLWDRGFWSPADNGDPLEALRQGELKFNVAGEKLKGSFVLVRMKHDRTGGSRTNWLLIKHRDAYARAGDGDGLLETNDRSVASGRTMKQIAAGKGASPVPFMLGGARAAKPDAVWHSSETRAPAPDSEPTLKRARLKAPKPPDAKSLKPVKATGASVLGITLSKPGKVLWPAEGGADSVSKKQLAEYLATIGPWMIAHLAGRPCSLIRAPDGIKSQQFFQRHAMPGATGHIELVEIPGDNEPYLQIGKVEGLVAMAQLAALEFHPWNCEPYRPAVPGRLIFDLDPAPDLAFEAVVEAAREIKERLEKLGLVAFCKTTGGKGLHVVTPLKAGGKSRLSWNEAKTFAQAVSQQMADDSPGRYLTKMTKSLRRGRIFIDYLRNDQKSTAVAPLSPRARPGAPVSMPLTWTQVKAGLDPRRFTVHSAARLFARSKAWADYDEGARPLEGAVRALIGGRR